MRALRLSEPRRRVRAALASPLLETSSRCDSLRDSPAAAPSTANDDVVRFVLLVARTTRGEVVAVAARGSTSGDADDDAAPLALPSSLDVASTPTSPLARNDALSDLTAPAIAM